MQHKIARGNNGIGLLSCLQNIKRYENIGDIKNMQTVQN